MSSRDRQPASGLAETDDLAEFRIPGRTRCQVCIAYDTIPEADAAKLRKAIGAATEISPSQVATWAKQRGYRITQASVQNHRRNHAGV